MRAMATLLVSSMIAFATTTSALCSEILALDHVALHVKDLAASADWYQKSFGFTVLHKWSNVWMIGHGNMKMGLFLTPNATTVANPDSALVMDHFAFSVDADKFQDTVNQLRLTGAKITPVEDTGIAYSVFLTDPDGYQVEVTSYHPATTSPPF